MTRQKFKNPMVNNQYKKPACHTDHCFQRHACCNNYRCCMCHCCLEDYQFYSKVLDRCVGNLTESRIDRRRTTFTTDPPPTKKEPKKDSTTGNANQKTTKQETATTPGKQETTKRHLRTSTKKTTIKHSFTLTSNVTSTWDTWKPTVQTPGSKSNLGYQHTPRDDKTSTIAGVAVALALVAIVAIVVLVIACSRRKKRNRDKAIKEKTSNNDAAVVTIPLTIENVSDKFRDNEEGTTSDTTIDSPITTSEIPNGTPSSHPAANGTHVAANHSANGHKRHGKKHKRSRHAKENGTAEQTKLCQGHLYQSNGLSEHHMHDCDSAPHKEHRGGQCTNNHVYLGAMATSTPNGHNLHERNGSLECEV